MLRFRTQRILIADGTVAAGFLSQGDGVYKGEDCKGLVGRERKPGVSRTQASRQHASTTVKGVIETKINIAPRPPPMPSQTNNKHIATVTSSSNNNAATDTTKNWTRKAGGAYRTLVVRERRLSSPLHPQAPPSSRSTLRSSLWLGSDPYLPQGRPPYAPLRSTEEEKGCCSEASRELFNI